MSRLWLCLLVGCGGGGLVDDWGGDWEGSFHGSLTGETWPVRMIDVDDWDPSDPEDGRVGWREWRGTFEIQAGADHQVAPIQLFGCEDEVCPSEDMDARQHDFLMIGYLNGGSFVCSGSIDGDTAQCDGQHILPGRPSIGPVEWTRAKGKLKVGEF